VTRHEEDGNTHAPIDDFLMKSHAAFSAEPHVEDEAAWPGGVWESQEFVRGLECFDAQANGAQECAESKPNSLVVVNNVDDGTVASRLS
jgi:hypothetical protein